MLKHASRDESSQRVLSHDLGGRYALLAWGGRASSLFSRNFYEGMVRQISYSVEWEGFAVRSFALVWYPC